jgi:NHL repeat
VGFGVHSNHGKAAVLVAFNETAFWGKRAENILGSARLGSARLGSARRRSGLITVCLVGAMTTGVPSEVAVAQISSRNVVTVAGNGVAGFTDGAGVAAQFRSMFDLVASEDGTVYVADTINNRIRKISPAGVVTTLAGDGSVGSLDGPGTTARFYNPYGIAVDASGTVFVADTNNHRIRKISAAGDVSTVAGSGPTGGFANGPASSARFHWPNDVAVDSVGNLFVLDSFDTRIRKISTVLMATGANPISMSGANTSITGSIVSAGDVTVSGAGYRIKGMVVGRSVDLRGAGGTVSQ